MRLPDRLMRRDGYRKGVSQLWASLRRPRFSFLDLTVITLAVTVIDNVQQVTAWPQWLAAVVVVGGALAVAGVIAFAPGVWKAFRG